MTLDQKRNLDTWYNSLPNRLKENIPHWRESTYKEKLYKFMNPTQGFIEVKAILTK